MMTRKGFEKLMKEYDQLFKIDRPKVVQGVADAAAEGDRSENAEYIYGRKRLREIDKKLSYLSRLLKDIEIVDPEKLSGEQIDFGATVTLRDENQRVQQWMLVAEGEADIQEKTISWSSPLGKSLLNKKNGDFVLVNRPAGEMEYEIIKIEWK